jgi:CDP-paratose 2-epimerase
MKTLLVTGSAGLIGAEAVRFFSGQGYRVVGIDNDMRRVFFGAAASTAGQAQRLSAQFPNYRHIALDIRDGAGLERIFAENGTDIEVIIHAAGQPSHDWAATDPVTDFAVNAAATLLLLECTRSHCPRACFVFTSTNKVYGDRPNNLPLVEKETRWEIGSGHPYFEHGIDETMSLDQARHSLYGVSKTAADLLVQEYGRSFGMNTVCFRCGCVTGPAHAGTMLHGFLSYLVKCAVAGTPYTVFGYGGKQVRDNIHAQDLVQMFWHYCQDPRPGAVYNAGGGRQSHCSLREAIAFCEQWTGRQMQVTYSEQNRGGDHKWYVSDTRKFRSHFPAWSAAYPIETILGELLAAEMERQ